MERIEEKLVEIHDQITSLDQKLELHTGIEEYKYTRIEDTLKRLDEGQEDNKAYFQSTMIRLESTFEDKLNRCKTNVERELRDDYLKKGDVEVMIESRFKKMLIWLGSIFTGFFLLLDNVKHWFKT